MAREKVRRVKEGELLTLMKIPYFRLYHEISPVSIYGGVCGGNDSRKRCVLSLE